MKVQAGTLSNSLSQEGRSLGSQRQASLSLSSSESQQPFPPSLEADSVKPGRRPTDLRVRIALAWQPRCSGHLRASPFSQAEALRLEEKWHPDPGGRKNRYTRVCMHTHPEVDRLTHRHDDNQKLGLHTTNAGLCGAEREGAGAQRQG